MTWGSLLATAASDFQSLIRPSSPVMEPCATIWRIRLRTSDSKPFITDRTTISTATAKAIPAIEITEMNEMKRFLFRDRT